MSVPNHKFIVDRLYATGMYDLTTHDGLAAFVDDSVVALNKHDADWGHLIKKPSQTNIHGHAEDAALYKHSDGTAQAVDFVGGAGGPNPQPGWLVDSFIYKHSDWLDPDDHDGVQPPTQPPPSTNPGQPYPDERTWWPQVFDVEVAKRYTQAGKPYPDGPAAFRWASRTAYDIRAGLTKEESLAKHLKELEQELGL